MAAAEFVAPAPELKKPDGSETNMPGFLGKEMTAKEKYAERRRYGPPKRHLQPWSSAEEKTDAACGYRQAT